MSLGTPYRTSWALLIGVEDYPNLPVEYQLNYAVGDVEDLKQMLVEKHQFSAGNIITLTNEQATRARITEAMGHLADRQTIGADDRVLVFFSGHGQTVPLPEGGEMGFILPYDAKVDMNGVANFSGYYTTCINMNELRNLAIFIPAKHVLFLMDACYSGIAVSGKGGLSSATLGYIWKVASIPVRQIITAGMKGDQSYEFQNWGMARSPISYWKPCVREWRTATQMES